jgi:hypothetical protein
VGVDEYELPDAGGFERRGDVVDHSVKGPRADAHRARPSAVFVAARDRHGRELKDWIGAGNLAGDDARDGRVRDERQVGAVLLVSTDRENGDSGSCSWTSVVVIAGSRFMALLHLVRSPSYCPRPG